MNERIQELEAQCWEPKQYGPPWFNSQKFAELIVRECASICYNSGFADPDAHAQNLLFHFNVDDCRNDK